MVLDVRKAEAERVLTSTGSADTTHPGCVIRQWLKQQGWLFQEGDAAGAATQARTTEPVTRRVLGNGDCWGSSVLAGVGYLDHWCNSVGRREAAPREPSGRDTRIVNMLRPLIYNRLRTDPMLRRLLKTMYSDNRSRSMKLFCDAKGNVDTDALKPILNQWHWRTTDSDIGNLYMHAVARILKVDIVSSRSADASDSTRTCYFADARQLAGSATSWRHWLARVQRNPAAAEALTNLASHVASDARPLTAADLDSAVAGQRELLYLLHTCRCSSAWAGVIERLKAELAKQLKKEKVTSAEVDLQLELAEMARRVVTRAQQQGILFQGSLTSEEFERRREAPTQTPLVWVLSSSGHFDALVLEDQPEHFGPFWLRSAWHQCIAAVAGSGQRSGPQQGAVERGAFGSSTLPPTGGADERTGASASGSPGPASVVPDALEALMAPLYNPCSLCYFNVVLWVLCTSPNIYWSRSDRRRLRDKRAAPMDAALADFFRAMRNEPGLPLETIALREEVLHKVALYREWKGARSRLLSLPNLHRHKQDAHECLTAMLDLLRAQHGVGASPGGPDMDSLTTRVTDVFNLELRTRTRCDRCEFASDEHLDEPEYVLSIAIPDGVTTPTTSLKRCLDAFVLSDLDLGETGHLDSHGVCPGAPPSPRFRQSTTVAVRFPPPRSAIRPSLPIPALGRPPARPEPDAHGIAPSPHELLRRPARGRSQARYCAFI